jgi:Zn-dependent metalloprotease
LSTNERAEDFFKNHQTQLKLQSGSEMLLVKEEVDKLGMKHSTWQQHYHGLPVENAIYKLHQKGSEVNGNGVIYDEINSGSSPILDGQESIEIALLHVNARKYAWQNSATEVLLKRIKKDRTATNYPNPELTILPINKEFKLVWKMVIFATEPHAQLQVFVDAGSGEILRQYELSCTQEAVGSGKTKYSGTQTITSDSIPPGYYRLRDYSRGGGIETYNAQHYESANLPDSAVDFIDLTNTWILDTIAQDDAAVDVHWGLEMSYDYFLNEHSRNSFDGNGIPMIAYVHVGTNWFNARFAGLWMEFGDGTGFPLTSLDVVAHEMAHGVTGTSAGLIYNGESGALNESFSDIFGAEVEFAALPATADYQIGTENFAFRDMSNPNSFGHPDTYLGGNYYIGPSDNGGVHTNSGVQNYWFYLLVEGGIGTNDIGNNFNVTGIGHTDAAQIAYRNLNFYLTPSSTYLDARHGALAAAEDIFGPCSVQANQVLNAWYAVGVGNDSIDPDLQILSITSPSTNCDLTTNEDVTFDFTLQKSGCGDMILPGDSIIVEFDLDGSLTSEAIVFIDTLFGGDTLQHTFAIQADLSLRGTYDLGVWVNYSNDLRGENDSIMNLSIIHPVRLDNDVLKFENSAAVVDSFYTVTNDHSLVSVAIFGNPDPGGINGLRMTGNRPQRDFRFVLPTTTTDIWNQNPDYFAQTCLCVDATTWPTAHLYFDLKQTFSKWYLQEFGFDLPNQASSFRVSVNGSPVSGVYHPDTYISDPYQNLHLNLDAYAGTNFEVCFETMNFVKFEEDTWAGSEGDNAYLDNIWLTQTANSVKEEKPSFGFFPNPVSDILEISGTDLNQNQYVLVDAVGKVQTLSITLQQYKVQIQVEHLSSGIYFLSVVYDGGQHTEKIIVQN